MTLPLFKLGRIVATPGAMREFIQAQMTKCLDRHHAGDWGDLDAEDTASNDADVSGGGRLLSSYVIDNEAAHEHKLWVITEADRSVTTLLLPSEY